MKNIFKDFLYFNQKDKIAIILLLVLIGIAGIYSIYINSLSKLDPSHFIIQEQIEKEFKEYEEELEVKEIIFTESNDTDVEKTSALKSETKKQNKKTKLTKGQVIDLNTASIETLTKIPGIGNTLAERIVDYRTKHGSFENTEQLLEIKGITNKKLIQILPFLNLTSK